MFGKRRKEIVLTESTLVILEYANAILEHVTCGSAKKFRFAGIEFQNPKDNYVQDFLFHGLAKTNVSCRLFEAQIIFAIDKSDEGNWRLDPRSLLTVIHGDLKIVFKINDKGGFIYYSDMDEEVHAELRRRWQFVR